MVGFFVSWKTNDNDFQMPSQIKCVIIWHSILYDIIIIIIINNIIKRTIAIIINNNHNKNIIIIIQY